MLLELTSSTRQRRISLTPLIDVVFILLLFFMLSSSFLHMRQIDVSAATEVDDQSQVKPTLTVEILTNAGEIKINDIVISIADSQNLKAAIEREQDTIFILDTREGIKTQTLIETLDAFKQAGADSVTLAGIN